METRKQYEERLLTELLSEVWPECLANILMYAAEYLRGNTTHRVRPVDLDRADSMDRCGAAMELRNREVR